MKVFSQLKSAQLDNLSATPANLPFGRMWIDTTDLTNGIPKVYTGSSAVAFGECRPPRLDIASAASITALSCSSSFEKLTGTTATTLHGITAGRDNQSLLLVNLTGQTLTIKHQSGTASADNQITTMTGADITTTGNGAAWFVYDSGTTKWLCVMNTA